MRTKTIYKDPVARFYSAVTFEPNSGCWLWLSLVNGGGYGRFYDGTRQVQAHRYAYATFVGHVADDLEVDHACRNRICVNPSHLEVVTRVENARRRSAAQTHCKNGHALTPENTYLDIRRGWQTCRICRSLASLRAKTSTETKSNSAKTSCLNGHSFDDTNTIIDKLGRRICRQCRRDRERAKVKSMPRIVVYR